MYVEKPNDVIAGYSLDRRKLIENLMHSANCLNDLGDYSIARDGLDRTSFKLDAFEEVYWNNVDRFTITGGEYAPNSERFARGISLLTARGSGHYKIDWSCNVKFSDPFVSGTSFRELILVPFVDGKLVWAAADLQTDPWGIKETAGPVYVRDATSEIGDDSHSMSGEATVFLSAGKSELGLLAIPLLGEWFFSSVEITNFQFVARRRIR